jgi:hypothetical protein
LADHQWIHLKAIPNMIDVLLEFGVFDGQSLALFCVELIRAVPPEMHTARVEIIRSITKLLLFKKTEIRRETLLPEFMPIIVKSINLISASKKPEELSKLLNSIVNLLLNVLHLLRVNLHELRQQIREELLFVTKNCLLPIIRCCNASVYNGNSCKSFCFTPSCTITLMLS